MTSKTLHAQDRAALFGIRHSGFFRHSCSVIRHLARRRKMDNPSADSLMRWREGDQGAAGEIFGRYAERLLALARSRLSAKLSRHIDPEDVVQSACRSFFVGARDGRYVLKRSGDLWRLLVAITVHKLQHQLERRSAGKRAL